MSAVGGLLLAWAIAAVLQLAGWFWQRRHRYAHLRGRWQQDGGKWLAFFQFQALLVALFAVPFMAVARNPVAGMTLWVFAAIAVWIASVAGESIADAQLARFRADPANRGRT